MNYKRLYKVRTVDFYLIILFLLFSIVTHLIASKIVYLPHTSIPLVCGTFVYMFALTLTDLVRAYSTKRNAVKFVLIEMIFVFFVLIISYYFASLRSPTWAELPNLNFVFSLALDVYKANFVGSFTAMILDIFLFSLLFNKVFVKFNLYIRFFMASVISTIATILIYTYTTDILFLLKLYPHNWLELTNYNAISNTIFIIFYSFICSIILKFINLYLEKNN